MKRTQLRLTGLVLMGVISWGVTDATWADSYTTSQPTIFHHRLAAIGFFNQPRTDATSYTLTSMPSLHQLFRTARSFRYVPDDPSDRWQSAKETSLKYQGDCEDKAIWLFTEMRRSGYDQVRLVVGKYRPQDKFLHVWILHRDENADVYLLDPTLQRRPWPLRYFPGRLYRAYCSFDGNERVKKMVGRPGFEPGKA